MQMVLNNTIYVGSTVDPIYTITNADVTEVSANLSSSIIGDELAIDQFFPTVSNSAYEIYWCFFPSGATGLKTADNKVFLVREQERRLYNNLPYGTPIWWYNDDNFQGKFYVSSVDRISKYNYKMNCVSAIGLLDGLTHYGGIYKGQTFSQVAADIIGTSITYSMGASVQNIKIIGWLPIATKRNNLHQLLFATGINITKDANGDVYFDSLSNASSVSISDSNIFYDGSVKYTSAANSVEITEHTYEKLPFDEEITLFNNTDGSGAANATVITFNEPVHDIAASGSLTISESGANYAIVSGIGILTGNKYTHTTHIYKKSVATTAKPKTISVTDATLVSVLNSENVANRVLSYHSSARTINADIIVQTEKPSNIASFNNPYGEAETALIANMNLKASSFIRASCEFIADYIHTGEGNNFNNVDVLTGSGTWTKPAGITRVRAVVIGGGQGGQSGGAGRNGEHASNNYGKGGEGGTGGAGGNGGNIFLLDTDSLPASVSYSCGTGGTGGVSSGINPVYGTDGTATTFGSYSSENGTASTIGIPNILSGIIYGLKGENGLNGGKGNGESDGAPVIYKGVTYTAGAKGADAIQNDGNWFAYGGVGGGAAVGSNGGDGKPGSIEWADGYQALSGQGGDGADGADGETALTYGTGGNGGHGGGGGAGGTPAGQSPVTPAAGWYGYGGIGGDGSDGAPGAIIIYF